MLFLFLLLKKLKKQNSIEICRWDFNDRGQTKFGQMLITLNFKV